MRRAIQVYEQHFRDEGLLASHIASAERACPEIKGHPYRVERYENCLGPNWGNPSEMAYDPYYLLIWETEG